MLPLPVTAANKGLLGIPESSTKNQDCPGGDWHPGRGSILNLHSEIVPYKYLPHQVELQP